MNYLRDGIHYSCDGFYTKGKLFRIVCYDDHRDTILIEHYSDSGRDSAILFYPSGQIREHGRIVNEFKAGIWKRYYEDGSLMAFRYYKEIADTFNLFYEKLYDENGQLYALRYPIRFRTNADDDIYIVGLSYELFIDLKYSEYDSVHSLGYIHESVSSDVKADTVLFDGLSLYIEFTPQFPGNHSIEGVYIELDATKDINDMSHGGDRYWRFDYTAVDSIDLVN